MGSAIPKQEKIVYVWRHQGEYQQESKHEYTHICLLLTENVIQLGVWGPRHLDFPVPVVCDQEFELQSEPFSPSCFWSGYFITAIEVKLEDGCRVMLVVPHALRYPLPCLTSSTHFSKSPILYTADCNHHQFKIGILRFPVPFTIPLLYHHELWDQKLK